MNTSVAQALLPVMVFLMTNKHVDRRPGPIQARFWLEWAEKPSPAMNDFVAPALLPVMVFLMTNEHVERRHPRLR
jgi:hypothetical protein